MNGTGSTTQQHYSSHPQPSIRLNPSSSSQSTTTKQQHGLDLPRQRQHYPLPVTPGEQQAFQRSPSYPQDIKETHHVSPVYDQGGYHPNGPSWRPRSPGGGLGGGPGHFHYQEDTTLSTFLSNLFNNAYKGVKSVTNNNNNNSNSSFLSNHSNASPFSLASVASGLKHLAATFAAPSSSSSSSSNNPQPSPAFQLPSKSTLGFIILCALWYLSSALSGNTAKTILGGKGHGFKYPVTLTIIQFAFVAGYSVLCLAVRQHFSNPSGSHAHAHSGVPPMGRRGSLGTTEGWGIKKPSKNMFQGTFMMSLFQIAGHVFSSMAIARVPVSTVHTIKALSPLFTVVSYAVLFRVRYGSATYLALLPLTLGVMLACSFDLRANAVGFLCALGSTVIFVSQNIFSKKLLPKDSPSGGGGGATSSSGSTGAGGAAGGGAAKLDKLNLLFYSSGMAFILMIPIWLYSDSSALLSAFLAPPPSIPLSTPNRSASSLLFTFTLNGTVHFAQNLLAFSILARTSPVTYSIASLVKRIAVICLAIIWSGQKVSFVQGVGMTMTFFGLWLYNRAKGDVDKGERKRGQVEKRQEMFLPTSVEDVRTLEGGNTPSPPPPTTTMPMAGYKPNMGYASAQQQQNEFEGGGVGGQATRNRSISAGMAGAGGGQHHGGAVPPMPPPPPPHAGGGGGGAQYR